MKEKFGAWKPIAYVLLPLLVFVILYDIWTAVLQYLGIWLSGAIGSGGVAWLSENSGTFSAICIMGGLSLSFLCLFKTARLDGFLKPKKEAWKQPAWQYAILVLGTILVTYGINLLFEVTGFSQSSDTYQSVAENQYNVALLVGLILYGVVSPFVEEVIFRGFVYGRMRVYMPRALAVLVSALLFGVYHGNLVQGIYGFVMGILFTVVYEKYKNFYLPVIMHAIANLVGYYIQLNGFI